MLRAIVKQGLRASSRLAVNRNPDTSSYVQQLEAEWETAKPFSELPGPTRWQIFRGFQKGGQYHQLGMDEVMRLYRKQFGDICLIPGLFGMPSTIFTFNEATFQRIYRTEGQWPVREGAEPVLHYRKNRKDEFFKDCVGLFSNGPQWGKLRSAVNPVLMQHRNVAIYLKPMQRVNRQFINRIRELRDKDSAEVPADFLSTVNHLTFESVATVALDEELGLLREVNQPPGARKLFKNIEVFMDSFFILGMKPSIYKYFPTPTYKRFSQASDEIFDTCSMYVNKAIERIERKTAQGSTKDEKSVLEQLLQIDRKFAIVLAMDMLMGGVDTTSTAIVGLLLSLAKNPEKQQILRKEILGKLPSTDRDFSLEDMKSLPYLRAFIKESMRVYPVIIGNVRSAGTDVVLYGYRVPKGTHLLMVNSFLLKDEHLFPRAEEFLPERWLRQKDGNEDSANVLINNSLNPFVYLPFGFGPRMCVGKRIVDLELELTVANLVRNFHIEYDYPTETTFKTTFLYKPNFPLKFKFTDVKY
ncbi:probable cytochrome P450 12c1, mitochondrial [Drosophila ficusphila]|uniref:probable cytochrome P450 12c1, mitochondrial n=1 Tax=Drosophila ficusphila TaxID=30025 RepID=UPI0007E7E80D|nr:probable cytochrome P450 12c1, mitochondrial [Drosophila ficusphila]